MRLRSYDKSQLLLWLGSAFTLFGAVVLATAFLLHDERVLLAEPDPFTMHTGEQVLVLTDECPWGRLMKVTGSVVGVDRVKECVLHGPVRFASLKLVVFAENAFGKFYVILVVLGTVGGGITAIAAGWRTLSKNRRR